MKSRAASLATTRRKLQRGIALVVALIAMVAMAFAGVALMRSVNATTAVAGNFAFHQAAIAAGDAAVEHGIAALFERSLVGDPANDAPAQAYFASRQSGENARGIPVTLQSLATYPAGAPVVDMGNGNSVRYVIERMCLAAGPATPENCVTVATSEPPLSTSGGAAVEPSRVLLLRQTIRVDGPGGAAAFIQVWLADIPGHRRLSWRAIGD